MSSLRNAIKRITHKERSQPQSRWHLGLLEKKKDYRIRSHDYHKKQARLKAMRERAAMRNPDEFYFGMHNARVDGLSGLGSGRHVKSEEARRKEMEEKGLGPEGVRIMKDQDLSYVRMRRMIDGKKVEKLQSSLHYLEGGGAENDDGMQSVTALGKMVGKKRKHTVFVEAEPEELEKFDVAKHFDTIPELMDRAFNRPRIKVLEKEAMMKLGKVPRTDVDDDYYKDDNADDNYGDEDNDGDYEKEGSTLIMQKTLTPKQLLKKQQNQRKLERRIAKQRSAAYTEMEMRNQRLNRLKNAEAHLVGEKQARMKGRKRMIQRKEGGEDGKPVVYKWRRKRAK